MLSESIWIKSGIWGDKNSPDISKQTTPIFGIRYSPGISMSAPLSILGGISKATIWWAWNRKRTTSIRVFTRLDGETEWHEALRPGSVIPGIDETTDSTRQIFVKILLSSTVSDIDPAKIPALKQLDIVVYDKRRKYTTLDLLKLQWRDEDEW